MKAFYSLSDFPERKSAGKNFITVCPKCGKKHLSISKQTGLYHCFYSGCDFHGKLRDFWQERSIVSCTSFCASSAGGSGKTSFSGMGNATASAGKTPFSGGANAAGLRSELPMMPED